MKAANDRETKAMARPVPPCPDCLSIKRVKLAYFNNRKRINAKGLRPQPRFRCHSRSCKRGMKDFGIPRHLRKRSLESTSNRSTHDKREEMDDGGDMLEMGDVREPGGGEMQDRGEDEGLQLPDEQRDIGECSNHPRLSKRESGGWRIQTEGHVWSMDILKNINKLTVAVTDGGTSLSINASISCKVPTPIGVDALQLHGARISLQHGAFCITIPDEEA